MPKARLSAVSLALLLCLAGCGLAGLSRQQDGALRAVFDKVRAGDLAGVERAYDPKYLTPAVRQALPLLQHQIPPGAARGRLLKGIVERHGGVVDYGGIYVYDYPQESILAQVEMRQDAAGREQVVAFNLRQAEPGISREYAFTLTGKKYYQYVFLVLVALPPILGIWALVILWRAPDIRWKWIWALAILVGFMDLTMDWTTGDVVLNVAALHPLWLGVAKFGPLSPWMISTSLPVAAIAFLLGYRPRRLARPWDGPQT